jgi:tetratricopeptide (TPR) repeat protein
MSVRCGGVWLWLVYVGSGAIAFAEPEDPAVLAAQLWEQGQAAMRRGQPDEAILYYKQSLATDPSLVHNHLSIAAAYLEKQDAATACPYLARFLEANPNELLIRARYADLLLQVRQLAEARRQFECFITEAQEQAGPAAQHLIRCHSRLMEIAEATRDEYEEHLHRGIGLLLLARKRSTLPDPEDDLPTEGLLCKAAAELTLARLQRPTEARPNWYLYEVWSDLGQRQPALCRLREAEAAAPFTFLTRAEQRGLHLAYQRYRDELR